LHKLVEDDSVDIVLRPTHPGTSRTLTKREGVALKTQQTQPQGLMRRPV
jgi:hypothetical protein